MTAKNSSFRGFAQRKPPVFVKSYGKMAFLRRLRQNCNVQNCNKTVKNRKMSNIITLNKCKNFTKHP